MLGILQKSESSSPIFRFTPTHVGNTWAPGSRTEIIAVHPHACGEYGLWGAATSPYNGSPPRMWGIPPCPVCRCGRDRFTPTHVGNTQTSLGGGWVGTVHPHACGEYFGKSGNVFDGLGSPPRMWGILRHHLAHLVGHRFTPTHVGNTSLIIKALPAVTVHPHACGEYVLTICPLTISSGSPPRMWGIRGQGSGMLALVRFTPTHVGNTCSGLRLLRATAVHPHACGEYMLRAPLVTCYSGSPPRMWGIRRRSG